MLRVAIIVSGGGTNLQAIIDAKLRGEIKSAELSLVVSTKEGTYALKRAETANIKAVTLKKLPKSQESAEEYGERLLEVLKNEKIDLVVLAGCLVIIADNVISEYKDRIINVHPSLIPSFCGEGFYGLKVHEAALEYGVKVSGATVHLVSEVVDGGRILSQKAVDILDNDTAETLQKRIMEEAEWKLLPEAIEKLSKEILESGAF